MGGGGDSTSNDSQKPSYLHSQPAPAAHLLLALLGGGRCFGMETVSKNSIKERSKQTKGPSEPAADGRFSTVAD